MAKLTKLDPEDKAGWNQHIQNQHSLKVGLIWFAVVIVLLLTGLALIPLKYESHIDVVIPIFASVLTGALGFVIGKEIK